MRYISLFSGIEAASVAWEPLGWEPLAFCEIDEFPSAVLAHRFPDVENLGDITKVDWKEVIARHGRPDVVVGGSPCQSFSVAGGRESLSGESRLMFEYVRALDEIRPRWFLWENVPGVLNTRDNAFAQLLGEVQKLGYGSLAWRVLDAQFFGVAQRRRRVFLVGRLGEGGSAAAVLFEPESLRGDNPSSREKRKALAADAGSRPAGADGGAVAFAQNTRDEVRVQGDGTISGALAAQPGMKQQTYIAEARAYRTAPLPCPICGADAVVTVDDPQEPERFWHYSCGCSQLGCDNYGRIRRSFGSREDAIANWNGSVLLCSSIDYKQTPKVNDQLCHTLTHEGAGGIHSAVAYSDCLTPWDVQSKRVFSENGVAPTLSSGTSEGANIQPSVLQHADMIAFKYSAGAAARTMPSYNDGTCNTLTADYHAPAVAFAQDTRNEVRLQGGDGTVVGALGASESAKGQGVPFVMATGQANAEVTEDMTPTLNCAHEQPIVVSGASTQYGDGVAGTLTARADSSPCADRGQNVVFMADDTAKAAIDDDMCGTLKVGGRRRLLQHGEEVSFTLATSQDQTLFDGTGTGYVVRRLTPVECERLQGFPSGWTDVPYKGKEHPSDTPRYKACGNSMAVPVIRWIGSRIQMVDEMEVRG